MISLRLKIKTHTIAVFLGILFSVFGSTAVDAGTYIGTHGDIHSKDTVAIDIILDTEGKTLNALEGTISLSGAGFIVKDISVAGSSLTIWPRKPSLSDDGSLVTFTGGTPVGVNDSHVPLFTLFVQTASPGNLTVTHASVVGYLNDGLGTKVTFKQHSNTVPVLAEADEPFDAQAAIILSDNQPPEPFTIEILQDPTVYAGMKYASFETTDKRSGVGYYEIVEGSNAPVRVGTTYVLQNQSKIESLTVRAFDKAGNIRTETYSGTGGFPWLVLAIIIPVLALAVIFRRKIRALFA